MSDLLKAVDTSNRVGLVKALERAAAGGHTSIAETLLGSISNRFPVTAYDEALRALNRAVHCHKWETATYLADFLADTAQPQTAQRGFGAHQACKRVELEVTRCLADHQQQEERPEAPSDRPFLLTDAIEDKALEHGIGFAIIDATVSGAPHAECAQKSIMRENRDGINEITFEHFNPDLPLDVYGGEGNPCYHFSLAEPDHSAAVLRGKRDLVVPSGPISLRLSYPPEVAGTYEVSTSGTREGLARAVAAKYDDLLLGAARYDLADLDLEQVVPDGFTDSGKPLYAVGVV